MTSGGCRNVYIYIKWESEADRQTDRHTSREEYMIAIDCLYVCTCGCVSLLYVYVDAYLYVCVRVR